MSRYQLKKHSQVLFLSKTVRFLLQKRALEKGENVWGICKDVECKIIKFLLYNKIMQNSCLKFSIELYLSINDILCKSTWIIIFNYAWSFSMKEYTVRRKKFNLTPSNDLSFYCSVSQESSSKKEKEEPHPLSLPSPYI